MTDEQSWGAKATGVTTRTSERAYTRCGLDEGGVYTLCLWESVLLPKMGFTKLSIPESQGTYGFGFDE
jgi:hypothetical protein